MNELTLMLFTLSLIMGYLLLRKRLIGRDIRGKLSRLEADLCSIEKKCNHCISLIEGDSLEEVKNQLLFSLIREQEKCIQLSLQIDAIYRKATKKSRLAPRLQDISPICFALQQRILSTYQMADMIRSGHWLKKSKES